MPYSLQEIATHNSQQSCWVVIDNCVYDVTEFLPEHPGGTNIILKYAGKDATDAFNATHPPGVIDAHLQKNKHLGPIDSKDAVKRKDTPKTKDALRMEREERKKPPISRMHNLIDLENVARKVLSYKALAYYSSATDDEVAMEENRRAFSRIFFWPRVMRPLSNINISTTILGYFSSLPVFVSGAALAKLGHPLGEVNITRACGRAKIIQMVSSNSSCSFAELAEARVFPDQPLFFQLYKHKDDAIAQSRVKHVEQLGYKAIFLTVDAVVMSNRERDIKAKPADDHVEPLQEETSKSSAQDQPQNTSNDDEEYNVDGTAGAMIANDDRDMTWEKTIPWLRSVTTLPIVIKGIQCVEDAVLAAEAGVDGIMISNHGGRQMEYSMPSVDVLYRLRQQRPDVFNKVEVYLDGGVRRGTVLMASAQAYGEAGVTRLIQILDREMRAGMALLGAATLEDLKPELVEKVNFQPAQMQAKL
ncbi:hypothetical protein Clacol_007406 [Clathrus columnatus]|uniref:Uncharacterized protein n=1 Tax=Clathrus columnatus TaxID=1419009 RepID=A0AAV5AFS4_9AGAM|nr:hypothetical protein Clacol_007406 [Clathrus columnatus]